MTTIPDFMPVLSVGSHTNPSEGACVMEYVSMLAGEPFTDMPTCTHYVLAKAAQRVNDSLRDEDRHFLVPLIGRLFGTSEIGTEGERKALSVALAQWCAADARKSAASAASSATYAAYAATATASATYATSAYASATASATYAAYAAAATASATYAAHDGRGAARVAFLSRLIDEYDRLTGRGQTREVTPTELKTITETNLVGAAR